MRRSAVFLLAALAVASTGCDKLKTMAGKGADGGAAEPTSGGSGGGVLGSLFDSTFEGEITTEISGKGDKTPKTLAIGIKSPKLRADLGALATAGKDDPFLSQGAAFILDPPAKKAYMLVPAKKMAMVIDFEKMKQQKGAKLPSSPGAAGAGKAEDPPKIDKTGKKETVAGYTCEIWKITSKDGSRAELCMAEGIKLMDFSDLAMQSPQFAAAAALGDLNHFPLRAVAFDKAGAEEGKLEAKKIEKKKLPDAQFTIPADFQQMDMAQMMAGMMGAGMGGPPGGHPGLPPNFKPPTKK